MIASIAIGMALTQPTPPIPVPPIPIIVGNFDPGAAIRDGSATCGLCRTVTARFTITYDLHTPVILHPVDDPDGYIWPVVVNPRVAARFFGFLPPSIGRSDEDVRRFNGRRTYCVCTGVRYTTRSGQTILRVERARMFVR